MKYYTGGKNLEERAIETGWKLSYKIHDGILLPEIWARERSDGELEVKSAFECPYYVDPYGAKLGKL